MAIKEIIETLVTVFKVEAEGVKQGVDNVQRDVNRGEKALNRMGDSAKKTSQQITGLAGDVKKLSSVIQIAATTMGLFKVMNNNIGMGNLSERTGQSVKGIQALQRQFEKMGYSAEEANASIQGFSNGLAAAIFKGEGDGLMLPAMFGVDVFKANGDMRDAVEVMLEIGDAARKMMGSEEKAIMMLQQYGMTAAQAHFAAREASRAEYAAEKQRATLDAPRIEKMREINRTLADQKAAISDLASEMLVQLNPTIIRAGEGIKTLTGFLTENQQATTLALKGWIAFKAFGINPLLGALVAAGLALDRFNDLAKESVKIGGSQGTYLQNLIMTDPETGASVADVLPENKGVSTSQSSGSGSVKDREKAIMDALIKEGLTKEQAAGAVGSMYQENATLDPGVNEKNPLVKGSKGGFGIMQWTGARRRKFQEVMGKKIEGSSLDEQIQYMLWEMRNDEKKGWNAVRSEKTASGAAAAHSRRVERPDERYAHIGKRQRNAEAVLASYSGHEAMRYASQTPVANNTQTIRVDNVVIHAGNADANGVKDAFVNMAIGAHDFNTGAVA